MVSVLPPNLVMVWALMSPLIVVVPAMYITASIKPSEFPAPTAAGLAKVRLVEIVGVPVVIKPPPMSPVLLP